MFSLIAAALISATPPLGDEMQVLAGANFEALVRDVDARCPASRVRYAKAAVLLDVEESFYAALSAPNRVRLDRVMREDAEVQGCMTRDGASCSAGADLGAYRKAGLAAAFVGAVCARGDGPWE